MENKLIQTGQWFWRDKEMSCKEFQKLSTYEKQIYIDFLLNLNQDEWSTNDFLILNSYGAIEIKNTKFLKIEDDE